MTRLLLILTLAVQPLLWQAVSPATAAAPACSDGVSAAACDCCCGPDACRCCVNPAPPAGPTEPPATPPARAPELSLPSGRLMAILGRPEADEASGGLFELDRIPADALTPAQARLCIWRT